MGCTNILRADEFSIHPGAVSLLLKSRIAPFDSEFTHKKLWWNRGWHLKPDCYIYLCVCWSLEITYHPPPTMYTYLSPWAYSQKGKERQHLKMTPLPNSGQSFMQLKGQHNSPINSNVRSVYTLCHCKTNEVSCVTTPQLHSCLLQPSGDKVFVEGKDWHWDASRPLRPQPGYAPASTEPSSSSLWNLTSNKAEIPERSFTKNVCSVSHIPA